jgi:hypothetical protein
MICSQAQAIAHEKDNSAPPGFRALFNGEDFTGWKAPEGDNGHWRVLDGVIDGSKRNGQWSSPPSLVQFKNIYLKEIK